METFVREWERGGSRGTSLSELDRLYEREDDQGTEPRWYRTETFGFYHERIEVIESERNPATHRIRVTRRLNFLEDYVFYPVVLFLVLSVFSMDVFVAILYFVLVKVLVGPGMEPPLSGLGDPVTSAIRLLPGLFTFAASVTIGAALASSLGGFGIIAGPVVVAGTASYLLTYDVLPWMELGKAGRLVRHHLSLVGWTLGVLLLLFFLVGTIDRGVSFLVSFSEHFEYSVSVRDGTIDVTAYQGEYRRIYRWGVLATAGVVIVLGVGFALDMIQALVNMSKHKNELEKKFASGVPSRAGRQLFFAVFAAAQTLALLFALAAVTLVYQLLVGTPPFFEGNPGWIEPFLFRTGDTSYSVVSGLRFFADVVLDEVPIVSGRVILAGLLSIALVPVAASSLGTLVYVIAAPVRKFRLLSRSSSIERAELDTATPVDVRVIDLDDVVFVQPVSLCFGRLRYVLITEAAFEQLAEREVDAVVLHGSRQLASRAPLYHAVCLLFGTGGGGRNLLLTFRDYPGLDSAADEYALARGVEADTLRSAIETLWRAKLDERASSSPWLPTIHPTFVPAPGNEREPDTAGFGRWLSGLVATPHRTVRDVYQLYFGTWLVDVVRRSVADRHDRLSDI